jgi:hypothetical protein
MITRQIKNDNGSLYAFEIDRVYIGKGKVSELLSRVENVSDIRNRKMFSGEPSDVHIKFKYQGKVFIVMEPYGDSSEYWIGPSNEDEAGTDISEIEGVFSQYKPPIAVKVFGDILTLNFGSLFSRS